MIGMQAAIAISLLLATGGLVVAAEACGV